MSDSDADKQLGLRCLLCDEAVVSDTSYSIHYTVMPHSGTLLVNAVQKLVGKNLDQYLLASSFLCSGCFSLFEQLDLTEQKCVSLRDAIVQGFVRHRGLEPDAAHGEEKPLRSLRRYVHPCSVCGRLFRRPCEVKLHMQTHEAAVATPKSEPLEAELEAEPLEAEPEPLSDADHESEVEAEPELSDWDAQSLPDTQDTKPLQESPAPPSQRGRPRGPKAGRKRRSDEAVKPRPKKNPAEPVRLDCSICGKLWRTRSELKAHEATHSTERPFICEICGQAYKHKPALDVHVGMHQGINPFCCPYCKKSFTQKGALQRHLPIHTGDAPFQCELCGKRFVHHTSFNMHTLAHTGEKSYKCSVCGLALLSASHLKRHTRVHTGERPYQCPTCGKRFAERYNLAAHQRIHQHSASKLHSCQLCGAGFDRKPKLEDHLASCHNKISDDRCKSEGKTWLAHQPPVPSEAWHHVLFDPARIQLLPSRGNALQ